MSMSEKADLDKILSTPKWCANNNFESFHSSLMANTEINKKTENSVWCHEYFSDIILSLKDSEKRRHRIDFKTRQASYRPILLQLMKNAADSLSLNRTTLHLGVYLLDCFMDTYTIIYGKLNASALMCLLIAAKIEETDQNIPKFSKLNKFVGGVYCKHDFRLVEKKILTTFQYDFIYPTAATFVESYSSQLVSYEDYLSHAIPRTNTNSGVFSCFESMIHDATAVLFNILNISLHDNRFVSYTPSIVGAACLAATRSIKKIQPVWTKRLADLTGYSFESIESYVEGLEVLYAIYAKCEEKTCDSPDSGIVSDKSEETEEDDEDEEICYHPAMKRRRILD